MFLIAAEFAFNIFPELIKRHLHINEFVTLIFVVCDGLNFIPMLPGNYHINFRVAINFSWWARRDDKCKRSHNQRVNAKSGHKGEV